MTWFWWYYIGAVAFLVATRGEPFWVFFLVWLPWTVYCCSHDWSTNPYQKKKKKDDEP